MTGIVGNDGARRQADQALAVPVEPVARLAPAGFDPSRCIYGERGQHFSIRGGPHVGLCNGWNEIGFNRTWVVGWNSKNFHYCPRGPWEEWVELARRILAFDAYASGTLTEGGDVKQAPGESLSGPVAKPDAQGSAHD